MAVEFGAATGTLTKVANRIEQARTEFEREGKNLETQMGELRGKWEGDGGRAFHILHTAWTEKHQVVTAALNRFHAELTATEKDNVASDEAAGSDMSGLLNRLGEVDGPTR